MRIVPYLPSISLVIYSGAPVCIDFDSTTPIDGTSRSIGNRVASVIPTISFGSLSARDESKPKDPTTLRPRALTVGVKLTMPTTSRPLQQQIFS